MTDAARKALDAYRSKLGREAHTFVSAVDFDAGWRAAARECLSLIQEHHDTVDGSYGTPQPNLAMRCTTDIQQHFGIYE